MTQVKRPGAWLIGPLLFVVNVITSGATGGPPDIVEAVKSGDPAAIRTLLRQRVDVNAPEPDGTTALHWAVQRNDRETADLLIGAGADAKAANRYGVTPLVLACTNGNAPMIDGLLKAGADPNSASPEGQTALMTAARTGNVEAIRTLLVHGADPNIAEHWKGQTALMWAASENHAPAIKALLEAGADVNARSKAGLTSLLFAVRDGQADATRVLLAAGANVNDAVRPTTAIGLVAAARVTETGPDGSTALGLAIINAHYDLAIFLLEHGADPNGPDPRGSYLHSLAWMRRPGDTRRSPPNPTGDSLELVRTLLERGAHPDVRIAWKEKKITYDRSEVRGPSNISVGRNFISFVGATPFYVAAKHSDVAFMRLLVAHGADPRLPTVQGITPLMAAAGFGFWDGETPGPLTGVPERESLEAVTLTWELGNDVNAAADFGPIPVEGDGVTLLTQNPLNLDALPETALGDMRWSGSTALHGAALRHAHSIIEFLVEKGARLDAKNKLGWTPLTVASGVLVAQTFKDWPDTAALLRKMMTERGLNPADSIICPYCAELAGNASTGAGKSPSALR